MGDGGGGAGVKSSFVAVRMLRSGLRGNEAEAAKACWKSSWVKLSVEEDLFRVGRGKVLESVMESMA